MRLKMRWMLYTSLSVLLTLVALYSVVIRDHDRNARQEDTLKEGLTHSDNIHYNAMHDDLSLVLSDSQTRNASVLIGNNRWVHLDLKGAPPKMDYLLWLVPVLRSWGVTGILIEYEDTFPYKGDLKGLKSAFSNYKVSEVLAFIEELKRNKIEAIPLVQTFGHLEFVLKRSAFMRFRDNPEQTQSLNIGMRAAVQLIQNIIDQVLEHHSDSRFIHIGADEVPSIGYSNETKDLQRAENLSGQHELYLYHVKKIAQYIKAKYPKLRILMWDDMIRKMPLLTLKKSNIASLVEPVVWCYSADIPSKIDNGVWQTYSSVFTNIWMASAFKGASGAMQYLPDLDIHVNNHISWMRVLDHLRQNHPNLKVCGMILTGWSRYDHFAALCDLLPVSLPSLALCLQVIDNMRWDKTILSKTNNILNCSKPIFSLSISPNVEYGYITNNFESCKFHGHNIFFLMGSYDSTIKKFDRYFNPISGRALGHCNHFSIGREYLDPMKAKYICSSAVKMILNSFSKLKKNLFMNLGKIFGQDTVDEWLDVHVVSFEEWLQEQGDKFKTVAAKKTSWEERPLHV